MSLCMYVSRMYVVERPGIVVMRTRTVTGMRRDLETRNSTYGHTCTNIGVICVIFFFSVVGTQSYVVSLPQVEGGGQSSQSSCDVSGKQYLEGLQLD